MAKYDYGGGCPCGLQKECDPGCEHYEMSQGIITPKPKIYGNTSHNLLTTAGIVAVNDMSNDFGFSFETPEKVSDSEIDALNRLELLRTTIITFLNTLKANPEKDKIYWPNREEKINKFIDKINTIAGK